MWEVAGRWPRACWNKTGKEADSVQKPPRHGVFNPPLKVRLPEHTAPQTVLGW